MSKRWAAWLRGIRWLAGGFAALLLVLVLAWLLFVPAADWLAHHDVGSAKGSLLQTARDDARGRLLTLGAGLFVVGALAYTARNFALSREGQVTDRYTKAIGQLGSKKLDVRIGGIYALERSPATLHETTRADLTRAGTSPARTSSARTSAARTSAARTSPARPSPTRPSPTRPSPTRISAARTSPARTSAAPGGPEDVPVPEGWERDTDSGRLKRAGTGSKPTGAN